MHNKKSDWWLVNTIWLDYLDNRSLIALEIIWNYESELRETISVSAVIIGKLLSNSIRSKSKANKEVQIANIHKHKAMQTEQVIDKEKKPVAMYSGAA